MRIVLWLSSIVICCNVLSNNVVKRIELQQQDHVILLRDVEIDREDIVEFGENFDKYLYRKSLKGIAIASILYTVVAGVMVVQVGLDEAHDCSSSFHGTIAECIPVCYGY